MGELSGPADRSGGKSDPGPDALAHERVPPSRAGHLYERREHPHEGHRRWGPLLDEALELAALRKSTSATPSRPRFHTPAEVGPLLEEGSVPFLAKDGNRGGGC